MALNDIKISQLPAIVDGAITDTTVLPVVESDSTLKITMKQIKDRSKFLLTEEPEITGIELSDDSELLVNELEQSKVTLKDFMEYVNRKIPAIPIHHRGSLRQEALGSTQTISDDETPILLTCFDEVVTERGDLTVDPEGNSITYTGEEASGSAIISIGLNLEFSGTEELELYLYVNDTKYSNTPTNMQGRGAGKPVVQFWQSDVRLVKGDKLTLRGRNEDAGSFSLTYLRSTFRVDID